MEKSFQERMLELLNAKKAIVNTDQQTKEEEVNQKIEESRKNTPMVLAKFMEGMEQEVLREDLNGSVFDNVLIYSDTEIEDVKTITYSNVRPEKGWVQGLINKTFLLSELTTMCESNGMVCSIHSLGDNEQYLKTTLDLSRGFRDSHRQGR